jgi:hypothetical protein
LSVIPKVGDLITERAYPGDGAGLILEVDRSHRVKYKVLCPNGMIIKFGPMYIEEECEVISESR